MRWSRWLVRLPMDSANHINKYINIETLLDCCYPMQTQYPCQTVCAPIDEL